MSFGHVIFAKIKMVFPVNSKLQSQSIYFEVRLQQQYFSCALHYLIKSSLLYRLVQMRLLALILTCSKLQDLKVGPIIDFLDKILLFERFILE